VGALAAPSFAVDSLLAYDGFGNGPLADLHGSQGGTGWNGAWADVMGDVVTNIGGPGLTYPALASTRGAARSLSSDSIYPIARYWRSFGTLPSGTTTLYVSFLMKSDESFGWGGLLFGNWPQAMIVGVPAGMGNFGLQLSQGLGDDSTVPLNAGETYLCVVKIVKNAQGSGSTWRLYVNPTVGSAEPGFPTWLPNGAVPGAGTSHGTEHRKRRHHHHRRDSRRHLVECGAADRCLSIRSRRGWHRRFERPRPRARRLGHQLA
jgi:hypothetical protein